MNDRMKFVRGLRTFCFAFGLCLVSAAMSQADAPTETRVTQLFQSLTQDEKLSLLALSGNYNDLATNPIPRLNIPAMHMADAPQGVKAGQATVFPVGVAMASTWDPPLIQRVGVALGEEAAAKGKQVLFGPCINIHRTPQGGRNFESFSEDPYVAAQMTVAYVRGIQSQHVAACVKHFACNNQETGRHEINVIVDERALHELYLPAFQAAVQKGGAWSIMDALNRVNGPWIGSSTYLLTDILKKEWGFDGAVISDWGTIHDTIDSANAGNDIELPQPDHFNLAALHEALKNGQITQATIDDKVHRILRTMVRTGVLDPPKALDTSRVNSPEHQKLALEVAQNAIILLKNAHNVLPLDRKKITSIAVIGPNAATNQLGGRWSADVPPFYSVSVLDAIKKKVGDHITVNYAEGTSFGDNGLPAIPTSVLTPTGGTPGTHGLKAEYYANPNLAGTPQITQTDPQVNFDWGPAAPASTLPSDHFSIRWTGTLTAPTTGNYSFSLLSDDGSRLFIDDKLVLDSWSDHGADNAKTVDMAMEAGHSYALRVEYYENGGDASMKLGWKPPISLINDFHDAVAAAAKSDVAIVVVGTSNKIEGEELDPPDLLLPGSQDQLIQAVAAVNKNTIVVLNDGTPVLMDKWLDRVPGLIEAWYDGQEGGTAIADVLFGDVNPSGKLTDTIAYRREDYSDFGNYPGANGIVTYAEGIYVGYRHFDKHAVKPLFPFGYGLSYTTFQYSGFKIDPVLKRGQKILAHVTITNAGTREGAEVAELYVRDLSPKTDRPVKELKGFGKVRLKPGQSATLTFPVDETSVAYYDVTAKKWASNAGRYEVEVGASSRDLRAHAEFRLE